MATLRVPVSSVEHANSSSNVVLLVDDEGFVIDVERRIVERCGFRCLSAKNAAEATEILSKAPQVELIILDALLPDTSGLALYHDLKQIKPSVKVIVCSGLADDGPAQAIYEAGADGFLPKPFRASDLMDCVRSVMGLAT